MKWIVNYPRNLVIFNAENQCMQEPKNILTAAAAALKLQRMTLELAEQLNGNPAPVVLIGIRNSGMVIAEKVGALLSGHISNPIQVISVSLDKNLPKEVKLSSGIDLNQKQVILIDDVTNSGRTLLYALKPLLEYHPISIQTMVLVERMHKLFPVKPDYVGLSVATTLQEHIEVVVTDREISGAIIR